jgi:hypothetical protein
MAEPHVSIALQRHPESAGEAVRSLEVTVRLQPERLILSYTLAADLKRLRIPEREAPRRADELWRHTCFEMFFGETLAQSYCELNFAPSGAWAMYRFSAQRAGMESISGARAPQITVGRSAAGLTLEALVFVYDIIPSSPPLSLRMGFAAVLEDEDGRLSYWAAQHPPGKPDFHHPDSFTLEFDL